MATTWRVETAWGTALVTEVDGAVVSLDPPTVSNACRPGLPIDQAPRPLVELGDRLVRFFDGEEIELASSDTIRRWLEAAGVDGFRRDALLTLTGVPAGSVVTYGTLAELTGHPRAARAAGTACARNPLPIIIPCHRVIAAAGRLGSYGNCGQQYKRRLLKMEGVSVRGNRVAPSRAVTA